MTRATTWANSDNLNVGYGTNVPERQLPAEDQESIYRVVKLSIDAVNSTFGASGVKWTAPAGSMVTRVWVRFTETHAGGTSIVFGDGSTTNGYVTATEYGATPAASTIVQGKGAYLYTATEGVLPGKIYAAATDLYFTKTGTYTAGKADVFVEYLQ
jgi:hypothetical protein